jgi:hypothetical protein
MNEFKYQFMNFILLVLFGAGIYWAFTTIDNSIIYDKNNIVENDQQDQQEFVMVNTNTQNDSDEVEDSSPENKIDIEDTVDEDSQEKNLSDEEKYLISKLQGLINDKINMKLGSHGTRVGTVQKFLNIYFDTNKKVDNEYGPGTMADVKKFQANEGLDDDGLAGKNTYLKMIEYLEK